MGRLSGNKSEVVPDLMKNLDKLFNELGEDNSVDVSIEMGIIEVDPKDGWVQWEPIPSQRTIIIKTNGGATTTRR